MPMFISAPHVRHPAYRVRTLRANPEVAVTIDTESFPPEVVTIRGKAEISEVDGIVPEYALAAHRYLGEEEAIAYLTQIDHPTTRWRVSPSARPGSAFSTSRPDCRARWAAWPADGPAMTRRAPWFTVWVSERAHRLGPGAPVSRRSCRPPRRSCPGGSA
jgi:hypothetical protein